MTDDRSPADAPSPTRRDQEPRPVERLLGWGEDVVYVGIAVLLFVSSVVLLVVAADQLLDVLDDFASDPIVEVLDTLLLVFIVVELLSAVRTTLSQRELVAEPFLIVGIIASIKEIVVLSVEAPDYVGTDKIEDTVWLMGVLTVTIGVLAASTLLVRRKEREPSEGDGAGPDAAHDKRADEPAQAS